MYPAVTSLRWRRAVFELIKPPVAYHNCFICGKRARVVHHIVWLKNGGHNWESNFCFLCLECHAQIHPWLK